MRYLGIDYGDKKVGLALSDEEGTMGFPHAVMPNTPRLASELAALIAEKSVGTVVVGESRDYRGADNPVMAGARALAAELSERTGVPIAFESEVLTSALARRAPAKELKSRAPKSRAPVDASAAAIILTSYLSHANHDE